MKLASQKRRFVAPNPLPPLAIRLPVAPIRSTRKLPFGKAATFFPWPGHDQFQRPPERESWHIPHVLDSTHRPGDMSSECCQKGGSSCQHTAWQVGRELRRTGRQSVSKKPGKAALSRNVGRIQAVCCPWPRGPAFFALDTARPFVIFPHPFISQTSRAGRPRPCGQVRATASRPRGGSRRGPLGPPSSGRRWGKCTSESAGWQCCWG